MSAGQAARALPGAPRAEAASPRAASAGPVDLEILGTLPALDALRPDWERLEREVAGATVYQTWAWVATWYEHFGRGRRLCVTAARDRDGRLVGIVPLSRAGSIPVVGPRLLHGLGRGNDLTEYVDALVRPEHARTVARAVFDFWDRRRRAWDLWSLPAVPAESAFLRELRARASEARYTVVAEEHVRVALPLPRTPEAYYAGLGRNMKKHLRKFANRLEREERPVEVVVVSGPDGLDPALDALLDLHRRRAAADLGRAHPDRFATASATDFLRTVARRLAERGRLRLFLLEVGGRPVAAQLCFALERRLHASHSGYDPGWAWHAVMMFLFRRCIERAIVEGFEEFDLGLGHDQEKLRWGGEARSAVNCTLASARPRSRVVLALQRAYRRWRDGRAAARPAVSAPESEPA
jgi:CelD/BcsL family acetyltransferase involved in cellulose biosynthesis